MDAGETSRRGVQRPRRRASIITISPALTRTERRPSLTAASRISSSATRASQSTSNRAQLAPGLRGATATRHEIVVAHPHRRQRRSTEIGGHPTLNVERVRALREMRARVSWPNPAADAWPSEVHRLSTLLVGLGAACPCRRWLGVSVGDRRLGGFDRSGPMRDPWRHSPSSAGTSDDSDPACPACFIRLGWHGQLPFSLATAKNGLMISKSSPRSDQIISFTRQARACAA